MKKLLSTLMALTMAMSISTVAFAAEAPPTYEWDKKNGVLILYSDQGYEDLFRDYITENNLDEKTADQFAVSYEIMNSLKTLRFGKDAGCYFPSEQFDTIESMPRLGNNKHSNNSSIRMRRKLQTDSKHNTLCSMEKDNF